MLAKNRFGDELWLSTESLQVMIGRICFRRKSGTDTLGRHLGSCEQVSRRTVQKWIDDAVTSGVIRELYPANVWVGRERARRFRRSATYELNPVKLVPAKSWDEWHAEKLAAKPAPRRIGPERSSSPPAQQAATHTPQPPTAASVPVTPPPMSDSYRAGRKPRRLTSREGPQLVAKMAELMRGYTRHRQLDGYSFALLPEDPRYRAPMSQGKALISACMTLGITEEDAREHLKLCCWKFEEAEQGP